MTSQDEIAQALNELNRPELFLARATRNWRRKLSLALSENSALRHCCATCGVLPDGLPDRNHTNFPTVNE